MTRGPKPLSAQEQSAIQAWAFIFRNLIKTYRDADRVYSQVRDLIRGQPEKRARFIKLVGSAEWWMDYEKHEFLHLLHAVFDVGLPRELFRLLWQRKVAWTGSESIRKVMDAIEPRPANPSKAAKATFSAWTTLRAISCFGVSMQELVRQAETDDEALIDVIRLDPTAINCAPCRRRISRAVIVHDKKFLEKMGGAIARPKTLQSAQYPELEICLFLLRRARVIGWFNEARANELFLVQLQDLRLYAGDQRALIRHIQRRKSAATRKTKRMSSPV